MNSNTKFACAFLAGAVCGAAGAWVFAKDRFERIAQEDIQSVKEAYAKQSKSNCEKSNDADSRKDQENPSRPVVESKAPKTPGVDIQEYQKLTDKLGYTNYSNVEEKTTEPTGPYIIEPDQFGEFEDDGYDSILLTLYSDGTLADDADCPIKDVDEYIGKENLESIGKYEPDILHIRNEKYKCDYEITADNRTYEEVTDMKPFLKEVYEDE